MVEEDKIQDWCWLNARVLRKFNYLVNQWCENLANKLLGVHYGRDYCETEGY